MTNESTPASQPAPAPEKRIPMVESDNLVTIRARLAGAARAGEAITLSGRSACALYVAMDTGKPMSADDPVESPSSARSDMLDAEFVPASALKDFADKWLVTDPLARSALEAVIAAQGTPTGMAESAPSGATIDFRERFADAYKSLSVAAFASPFWNQTMEELLVVVEDEIQKIAARRATAGTEDDIEAICDAYESGVGHGLQRDGHRSGAAFANPACGKAYEIGYTEGESRATAGTTCEHDWPEADGQTDIDGRCTKCGLTFQRYMHR